MKQAKCLHLAIGSMCEQRCNISNNWVCECKFNNNNRRMGESGLIPVKNQDDV